MQDESRQLRLKIRELCVYLHTANAGCYPDEMTDSTELEQLLKLSSIGMLGYIRQKAQDVFQQSRTRGTVESYKLQLETEVQQRTTVRGN